ncbi:hypothetical protein OG216_07860 [Streptomycetaceae bacterium NBC_01309]
MPDFVDWLFEDHFDESFDSAGEFLNYTLGESLSSDGQGGDASVAAVPFVAALAADDRVPDGARVGPRLDDIQAPAGSGRADVVALIRALTTDIGTADAIEAVARWDSVTALGAATPADRRVVALSVLRHDQAGQAGSGVRGGAKLRADAA